tara:strand:- start:81704 stop:82093 length:390 start_codon:yes stop_codon:yes gene_type:complete
MAEKNINIAVYGTLRSGFHNHRVLGDSKLVSPGWTKEKYKLTANGIPFVNPNEALTKVKVEVYSVTPSQLPDVDRLEGYNPNNHDDSWYKRTLIKVELDDGNEVEASIYFCERDGKTLIESGDYADYKR